MLYNVHIGRFKTPSMIIADKMLNGNLYDVVENDIEKYGSGFIRIREAISKYPSMKFSFRETGHGFVTEFSYAVQKISTDKVTDKVTDSLTDNQTTIVHLMRKNEHITTNEIAAKVKISQRKVKENISKLKELGIIERLGSAKGGYWKVLK